MDTYSSVLLLVLLVVVAVLVVGSLIISDLEREPVHAIAALLGGVAGFAFGAYRARSTYVAAVPQHKGIVLRHSDTPARGP